VPLTVGDYFLSQRLGDFLAFLRSLPRSITLDPVGIIANPLVVALLADAADLLVADVNHVADDEPHSS